MNKLRQIGFQLFLLLGIYTAKAQNFGGNPSSIKWHQINSANSRVIFPAGLDSQANRIANVLQLLGDSTANSIGSNKRKWNIILQNQTTISNAYVRMAPVMSEFYMTPDPDNFSSGSLRWDDNLAIHEARHIQQFSNFNKGFTKLFSFFLGQEGQLLANGMIVPDYFFEGDAVYQETLVSKQGRGRMPSFYNGFKSLWKADKNYSWMKLRSGSLKDYTPNHYQLGYQMVAYGYEKYGEDFWKKVTNDAVRFKGVFYPVNRAIENYSGKSYKQFREDAFSYFKAKAYSTEADVSSFEFITSGKKNNVIDYRFPNYISNDSILVFKRSNNEVPSFYMLTGGSESKIRVRDIGLDDYFSYKNGKLVYAAYQSDARWGNRDYSVIKILDIYTGRQKQITFQSKYFSPDINGEGTELLAVSVNPDGTNYLCKLNAATGEVISKIPNPENYFHTQTRYVNSNTAVSAVRSPQGKMTLVEVDLTTGESDKLIPLSFNVLGYPLVKGDTVYFSAMHKNSDKVFALTLNDRKIFQLSNNDNGVYQPSVNSKGELLVSAFTADGNMLARKPLMNTDWKEIRATDFLEEGNVYFSDSVRGMAGSGVLNTFDKEDFSGGIENKVSPYRKSFRLFNFHSWRPVVDDPEYGYSFFSDNVLSSFSNILSYTYNRSDKSHTIGFNSAFAGWFPVLGFGVEESFNRTVDTALGKSVSFNAATAKLGVSIPLRFVGGRTYKYLSFGAGYNLEQYYYRGVGKNIFDNRSIDYMNAFLSFSNIGQQAVQHINPRWAQSFAINYRDAVNFRNSHKFVGHASFYFPGLFRNHSLVINSAFQKRDTLPDLFSKNFSYSRGYEALSTRRMYKLGVNYHFTIFYPDWGFANILFFQRIRANAFYDYTNAKARVNGLLTEIKNRSAGTELYVDAKLWNALPLSFGIRFSHLLDTDLLNPTVKNRWEIIIPIGLIPQ